MISIDFAPNETINDAIVSLKLLFQPWRWLKGKEIDWVKKRIQYDFPKSNIFFFLTGRSALYNLLKSLSLPKDSEIIVQAFTCEAVILPIIANNLKPIYVDIEPASFSINPIDLAKKITKNTKIIILQHTYGLVPINRNRIINAIKKHKLLLIEDIAHGITKSKIKNQKSKLKTEYNNSVYLMSFGRSKALSSVFGGAIVTEDKAIGSHLQSYQQLLPYPKPMFIFRLLLYKPLVVLIKYTFDLGFGKIFHIFLKQVNLLIPEITDKEKAGHYDRLLDCKYLNALACLLKSQYNKLDQMNNLRAQICSFYIKNIDHSVNNQHLTINHDNLPLIRFPLLTDNRDKIIVQGRKQNIFLGKWYDQVVAPKSLDLVRVGYQSGSCPVAEKICQRIINLPTLISIKKAKRVINILNDVMYGNTRNKKTNNLE